MSWLMHRTPPNQASVTVILLVVSVPVLSLQMVVAPPIVSQALRCRTRLLSRYIFIIE